MNFAIRGAGLQMLRYQFRVLECSGKFQRSWNALSNRQLVQIGIDYVSVPNRDPNMFIEVSNIITAFMLAAEALRM